MHDLDSASKQCEELGCLPVAFLLHRDTYDWKPAFVKTDHMEKRVGEEVYPSLCLPVSARVRLGVNVRYEAV